MLAIMGMKQWLSLAMGKKPNSSSSAASTPPSSPQCLPSAAALPIQQAGGLRQLFDNFDADGDGRISAADLECLLRRVGGLPGCSEDAASMLWAADLDGDGYISLEEFASVCGAGEEVRHTEELRTAFEVYDRNGDGVITPEELHQVLNGLMGKGVATLAECRGMIRAVDCDGDGAISFDEFDRMMTRPGLTI